jgi:hypothetical protein
MPTRIDILNPKQTINGPDGIKLHLDAEQVFIDNPGQGTPCMIQLKNEWATLNCVVGEGEVGYEYPNAPQIKWLHSIEEKADEWLTHWVNVKKV